MNITLIGMPASGKSTIGVMLAKYTGRDFLDTDILIQNLHKKSLSEIILSDGMDGFLKLEDETVAKVGVENTVIATGGSVVYGEKSMANLKSIGKIVHLYADLDVVKKRISNLEKRGVVHKPDQSLEDLYEERSLLYARWADYKIDTNLKSPDQVCFEIMDLFE